MGSCLIKRTIGGKLKYIDHTYSTSADYAASKFNSVIDFSDVPNYDKLTINNFCIIGLSFKNHNYLTSPCTVSYNASTGKYTFTAGGTPDHGFATYLKVRCFYV